MNEKHKLKDLPRDERGRIIPFSTEKHHYTPLLPGSPIGIKRWQVYEQLKVSLAFGRKFKDIYDELANTENVLVANKPSEQRCKEALLLINSQRQGILKFSEERYNTAFYIATLLILREDEDIKEWNIEFANEKIADWQEAGYNEQDFFLFALSGVNGFKERFKSMQEEQEALKGKLWGYGGSTMTEGESLLKKK